LLQESFDELRDAASHKQSRKPKSGSKRTKKNRVQPASRQSQSVKTSPSQDQPGFSASSQMAQPEPLPVPFAAPEKPRFIKPDLGQPIIPILPRPDFLQTVNNPPEVK